MNFPKVKQELISSTVKSWSENPEKSHEENLTRIMKYNPVLWQFLELAADCDKPEEWKDGYVQGAMLFYTLLYKQHECDLLELGIYNLTLDDEEEDG